jgi:hypothetical protein
VSPPFGRTAIFLGIWSRAIQGNAIAPTAPSLDLTNFIGRMQFGQTFAVACFF